MGHYVAERLSTARIPPFSMLLNSYIFVLVYRLSPFVPSHFVPSQNGCPLPLPCLKCNCQALSIRKFLSPGMRRRGEGEEGWGAAVPTPANDTSYSAPLVATSNNKMLCIKSSGNSAEVLQLGLSVLVFLNRVSGSGITALSDHTAS